MPCHLLGVNYSDDARMHGCGGARTWKGLIPASAECMLKHYADDRDASAIIVNEVDLDSTGRAVIRYK